MNGQSSLILSAGGGREENHRNKMSRIANVANMVISHRKGLPEELYSWLGEQRQICANNLGLRNFSC